MDSSDEKTLMESLDPVIACTWGQERCVNLGKNDKIQSIKNGRRELEKKMAESEKIIAAVTTCLAPCDAHITQ